MSGAMLIAADAGDLQIAIRNSDYRLVESLLRSGANVNSADADGTTALMHAVIEANADLVRLLIDKGANVNAKNALDSTALMYAATTLTKTRLLAGGGADVNVVGKRGATPLSVAATTFGSTPVLKLLIAKGAKPDDRLMAAVAQKGDLEAIRFLLSSGVSAGGAHNASLFPAVLAPFGPCVRLFFGKGPPAARGRADGGGVLERTPTRGGA